MSLRDTFHDDFTSTAFQTVDGEQRIIGKNADIEIVDGMFDIWIVRHDRESIAVGRRYALLVWAHRMSETAATRPKILSVKQKPRRHQSEHFKLPLR